MNENPFQRPMPVVVMLRNRAFATVEQLVEDRAPFSLLGKIGTSGVPLHVVGPDCEHLQDAQLWRSDGRWREDGRRNELDIVGVVTRSGSMLAVEPFAAAAGAKEGGPL